MIYYQVCILHINFIYMYSAFVEDPFLCLINLALLGNTFVSFFGNGQLDTVGLGQRYVWFHSLSDYENVGETGSKSVTCGVLNVDDVEGTRMAFSVHDGSYSTGVTTSSDHA